MSIKEFIEKARQEFPEVDDYFRLRPELEIALSKVGDGVELDRIFAIAPSFVALLNKYGIMEKLNIANKIDGFEFGNEHRLLAQVFGYPWRHAGLERLLTELILDHRSVIANGEDEACDKQGSCGDCECNEDGTEEISVVLTPDGDLAYGVSDAPLTIDEEVQFFDTLRKSGEAVKEAVANHDPVNHPKHYTGHASGVECIELSEKLSFNLGNAFKYVFRRDDKENTYQDLSKAEWYLKREIGRLTVLMETMPASVELLIHPAITMADYAKVNRIIAAETNENSADYYSHLFNQAILTDEHDLVSLHYAHDSLKRLMEDVRREQDEAREG